MSIMVLNQLPTLELEIGVRHWLVLVQSPVHPACQAFVKNVSKTTIRRLYPAITDSDNKLLLLAGEPAIWMVRPSKIELEASILTLIRMGFLVDL